MVQELILCISQAGGVMNTSFLTQSKPIRPTQCTLFIPTQQELHDTELTEDSLQICGVPSKAYLRYWLTYINNILN